MRTKPTYYTVTYRDEERYHGRSMRQAIFTWCNLVDEVDDAFAVVLTTLVELGTRSRPETETVQRIRVVPEPRRAPGSESSSADGSGAGCAPWVRN